MRDSTMGDRHMFRRGTLALHLAILLATSVYIGSDASAVDCANCPGTSDQPVCALVHGMLVNFPNECLTRCQGIDARDVTKGACQSQTTTASASEPDGQPRASGAQVLQPCADHLRSHGAVSWDTMSAHAAEGGVYVGTCTYNTQQEESSEPSQRPSTRMESHTSGPVDPSPLHTGTVMMRLPHGHVYVKPPKIYTDEDVLSFKSNGRPPITTFDHPDSSTPVLSHTRRSLLKIIGKDERTKVDSKVAMSFPWSANLAVIFKDPAGKLYSCSGFMLSRRLVVTAGHCVYDSKAKGFHTNFVFAQAGYPGQVLPVAATEVYTFNAWINTAAMNYDIGWLYLNQAIGDQLGWFGAVYDCSNTKPLQLTLTGYPVEPKKPFPSLWKSTCTVTGQNPCKNQTMQHTCDAVLSETGGPMWTLDTYKDKGTTQKVYDARGVHTCEYTAKGSGNCGVWFRPEIAPTLADAIQKGNTPPPPAPVNPPGGNNCQACAVICQADRFTYITAGGESCFPCTSQCLPCCSGCC